LERGLNVLNNRRKKIRREFQARLKEVRSRLNDPGSPQAAIWIFGCQRSGTTFLENIFRQDLDSVVFGEFSELTIREDKTVLAGPEIVRARIGSQRAKYAVVRPLYESDRARELLGLFPAGVGIWLYRDCAHVVDSMVRKWGAGFFEVSRRNETDDDGNWRLEEPLDDIRSEAASIDPHAPVEELYARYWLLRNRLPFDLGLDDDPGMIFLNYRTLISDPHASIRAVMKRAGLRGLWKGFNPEVDRSRADRPVDPPISAETLRRCSEIYGRLEDLGRSLH
jgi:hypothetical protein